MFVYSIIMCARKVLTFGMAFQVHHIHNICINGWQPKGSFFNGELRAPRPRPCRFIACNRTHHHFSARRAFNSKTFHFQDAENRVLFALHSNRPASRPDIAWPYNSWCNCAPDRSLVRANCPFSFELNCRSLRYPKAIIFIFIYRSKYKLCHVWYLRA